MTEDVPPMTSHRPYLLRALAEWIADNDMTPHLLVDATQPGVQVPSSAVKEGRVVLNIAQRAVAHLVIDNLTVSFSARFGGVSYPVNVPISAVLAIYARETGQGMALPEDIAAGQGPHDDDEPPSPDGAAPDEPTPPPAKRPHLRVVK
ncbi:MULTISPECIES: ClpXP protease specificity-enhancing factor [Pseudoxanthomonas]|jgi:stringent starvation protein B|uniref:ClpXP protease specificity-enhancing factor n=1 Tax=Pseudoxanthomonas winnipegensis TaxID=2480810 RepID=A0A4Q8LWB5_9GAMM|nr:MULTISPECIES: ClpXP protease specificity-enhancing factor [Pseudoxanthomonas]MDQ1119801.1 stringent starvation protein B [Pseudoxanthomonas winnipegensis]MDQ1133002.1 stringent starvation protein B [Pseudoxanthomonas winnipegensis]MDR6136995.1 stringent starvation protein B [Pseudoxanthomonas sp. SORGH_AS_0997]RZZ85617.1 ClpXP protease specificity-enhancing factor [Pseudoxanthomonas winnipegensis]RZZ88993.1 ClpXP protease specificity-enhancing factor [Pseudoxanthomonas winnipegensis]